MENTENNEFQTQSRTSIEPILISLDEEFFESVLSEDHGSLCLMI